MNVSVENLGKNAVQLSIEVGSDKFEHGLDLSYKKNAHKFNVPGFRKGKAPRKVIERMYGVEVLYEDAFNLIFPDIYDEAVVETKIIPMDMPEINIKQIGIGKNLIFTAKVTVKPDFELGVYKGVEVEKEKIVLTEEDVESALKNIQEKNARIITVEDREVRSGDIVDIDFEGFMDDLAFEGGKATDYKLEIGKGEFIPGFEEQIIGTKIGEEIVVNVTFPEDYHKEEFSNRDANFNVKINGIKVKQLPDLDDEFAKDVSEFDNLEEYKKDLKSKLIENAELHSKNKLEEDVIKKVVENTEVDIPEVMIEKHIDNLLKDFEMSLWYQGLNLERYMELMRVDMQGLRKSFYKKAEQDVKTHLVMEKIASTEKIEVSEDELELEKDKLSEQYKKRNDKDREFSESDLDYIETTLRVKKTIDLLVENAKIS